MIEIDKVDLKILNILQEDVRTPIKEIADRIFLSQAAVSARINAMKKNGVIRKSHVAIDPAALGYNCRCFTDIKLYPGVKEAFEDFLKSSYNVIEATYVTGEYSAFMKLSFADVDEMAAFLKQLEPFGETCTKVGLDRIIFSRGIRIPDHLFEEQESGK